MVSANLARAMNSDLAAGGADVTVRRLFHEVVSNDRLFPTTPAEHPTACVEWVTGMGEVIKFCDQAEEGFSTVKAATLALIYKRWIDLPKDFRDKYKGDFYNFATAQTGKARTTIENHMRAVEIFFFSGITPAKAIRIPERDQYRRPVKDKDTGEIIMKEVEWNPFAAPISKLVLMTSRATARQMEETHWAMLMDPGVTWDHINVTINGGKGGGGGGGSSTPGGITYKIIGPNLVACEFDQEVSLGELDWEDYYDNPNGLARRAINRLALILGIPMDEEVILQGQLRDELKEADYDDLG
jgi:hypothetical protein